MPVTNRANPVAAGSRKELAVVLLAVLVCACSSATNATSQASPSPSPSPSGLATAGTVAATIPGMGAMTTADDQYGVAADDAATWVYNGETGVLTRVDVSKNSVVATVTLAKGCQKGRGCGNVALGFGSVWVANEVDGTITRVDAATNKAVATITISADAAPMVYTTSTAVWSANYLTNSYSRINPATNKVVATLSNHNSAEAVTEMGSSTWLCDASNTTSLTRLDSASYAQQALVDTNVSGQPYVCFNLASTAQAVWVSAVGDSGTQLERVDPTSNKVVASFSPPGGKIDERGLVTGGGAVWIVDAAVGLERLDPQTARPAASLALSKPAGLAYGAGSVWVMTADGKLTRVTPAS